MHNSGLQEIADRMQANGERIGSLIRALPESSLRKHHAADEFSVIEHVCHLRDLECDGFTPRISSMLAKTDPQLFDFDGAAAARAANYLSEHCGDALNVFLEARARNVALVREAAADSLERVGHYEPGKPLTFRTVLQGVLAHDEDHIHRLRILAAL